MAALPLLSCTAAVEWFGVRLLLVPAPTAPRELLDLPYTPAGTEPGSKQRLDLFLPAEENGWPLLVFVPGGGWTRGDRALTIAGQEIYRNVGRFFASQGIGAAVLSYRLLPTVDWRSQADDVAAATTWAAVRARSLGGSGGVFVSGHSAGAQLAARVGLAGDLPRKGGEAPELCGVIAVSGAGYDLAVEGTYLLDAELSWYEERFGDAVSRREASPLHRTANGGPPFLLVFSEREWLALRYQNRLLAAALAARGFPVELLELPGEGHGQTALGMSDPVHPVARAMLAFIHHHPCSAEPSSAAEAREPAAAAP